MPLAASARFSSGIFTSPKWKMEAARPASTLGRVSNRVTKWPMDPAPPEAIQDFIELFQALPKVDAGLAASIFHFGEVKIPDLKRALAAEGIPTRL